MFLPRRAASANRPDLLESISKLAIAGERAGLTSDKGVGCQSHRAVSVDPTLDPEWRLTSAARIGLTAKYFTTANRREPYRADLPPPAEQSCGRLVSRENGSGVVPEAHNGAIYQLDNKL
jgi:hypothetical protein